MTTHSKLSPSSRHRWSKCPGSVREEAKYPPIPSGPAAIDGTHSHSLLEWCLALFPTLGVLRNASEAIGQTLTDHEGEFTVDADRAERVQMAVDYVRGHLVSDPLCQIISERRVNPASLVGRDDMSGTVDIQIISGDGLTVELIDYKDGMGVVEAENNEQLEQYAVGVWAEMVDNQLGSPWSYRMTIIQPKLRSKGMTGISTCIRTAAEMSLIKGKMMFEAVATDAPDAPLIPGDSQCKFCAHKGACTALLNKSMAASNVTFTGVLTQPFTPDVAQQFADKEPTTMSNEQIVKVMEAAPLMRQMLEAVEAEAQRRLEAGHEITGLKLVNGRGSRSWALSEDDMAEKLKKFGIPKDAIYESKLISPAKAEKLVWEKKDGTKVKLSDRQLEQMKRDYVATVVGKPTVALASDARKAVTVSAAAMFEAVDPPIPSWLSGN